MGQGLYSALVWGALWDYPEECEVVENWQSSGYEVGNHRFKLRSSYESTPNWIGFMLADDDGNINTRYEPSSADGDYYPQIGICFYRKAFAISSLENMLEENGFITVEKAKLLWSAFSKEMKAIGIDVPIAEILLINDWH